MESPWKWPSGMAIITFGRRSFEVAQGQLQASVLRVIIVADGESDIDGIACQKLLLLHSFRHIPAEDIESDSRSEIWFQFTRPVEGGESCFAISAANRGTVRMTTRSGHDGGGRKLVLIDGYRDLTIPVWQIMPSWAVGLSVEANAYVT